MEKKVLKNGLTILYENRDSETVVIQTLVKSGAEHEEKSLLGVAHFVEHRAFETKNRTQQEIASEIEDLGGEMNAFTGKENTNFYIYIPKKHFEKGIEIMSDMMINAHFDEKECEKEKKIILEEVKLWKDDPKLHQWNLFESAIFKNHSAENPTLGTEETIKNITNMNLKEFYENNYTPENMIITIIGNIDNVFDKIEEKFKDFNRKLNKKEVIKVEPENELTEVVEKRNIDHSYMILGYKVPLRDKEESYTFDIIAHILGSGLSSRLFNEIRTKRGLAYQIGMCLNTNKDTGYLAVYLSTDKSNLEECKKIILNEFKKLSELTEEELNKAKTSIEGNFILRKEDPIKLALEYSFWEYIKDAELLNKYINNIKKVSLKDIKNIVNKYLNEDYTSVIIEQQ